MTRRRVDVAVIGGGPAGSAAAMTAARGGASVLLLEQGEHGFESGEVGVEVAENADFTHSWKVGSARLQGYAGGNAS